MSVLAAHRAEEFVQRGEEVEAEGLAHALCHRRSC